MSAYIVITPVRNESARIDGTLRSMAAQSVRPAQWIIVDDGSTDGTADLIAAAAAQHRWITLVRRPDRGYRKPGTGVMEAFHEGLARVSEPGWNFLAKLDGDLAFAPDYFASCLAQFAADPMLGIGGGVVCSELQGVARPETTLDPAFHVRGATKIYRRACWEAIGGLIRTTGWDTMDEVKANMLGWRTRSFADLPVIQWRATGGADGAWRNWFKNGRANYVVGYQPVFMAAKCLRRFLRTPAAWAPLALACGFISGYLRGVNRPAEPQVRRYLRRQQWRALLGRESLWNQSRT